MGILSSGKTDIGRTRRTNQDSIYLNPKKNFFLVADGMGGHNGGDIASAMAIKNFSEFFFISNEEDISTRLQNTYHHTNMAILNKATQEPILKGMGTTLVALYFKGAHAYIGNVGDSRAYLISSNKLYQLTRDHSLVHEKLNIGIYNRDEAKNDKNKNILVRSVGFEENLQVDLFQYKVARYDMFLICSDGLHGRVSDANILEIVNNFIPDSAQANQTSLDQTIEALVNMANVNGGQDNISVILTVAK